MTVKASSQITSPSHFLSQVSDLSAQLGELVDAAADRLDQSITDLPVLLGVGALGDNLDRCRMDRRCEMLYGRAVDIVGGRWCFRCWALPHTLSRRFGAAAPPRFRTLSVVRTLAQAQIVGQRVG
ncbi:hypothetical protein [Mesorhizobium sp. ES1-1]|uniref:hypothetical protein n=1 Tax=Mesorhizobium sp. ES1-1 TaxID=2876629 RepID=UPI001CC9701D|nr:hypothetical protein [Mesorhizobium sp. ES1-1]MBZ9678262.1 hypothetical protein [Mesorhizobium sp. ES1-1]